MSIPSHIGSTSTTQRTLSDVTLTPRRATEKLKFYGGKMRSMDERYDCEVL